MGMEMDFEKFPLFKTTYARVMREGFFANDCERYQ